MGEATGADGAVGATASAALVREVAVVEVVGGAGSGDLHHDRVVGYDDGVLHLDREVVGEVRQTSLDQSRQLKRTGVTETFEQDGDLGMGAGVGELELVAVGLELKGD